MDSVAYDLRGDVAVLTLIAPPVNSLGFDVRAALAAALDRAQADSKVRAIVLIGSDRAFSGGADIREFGSSLALALAEPNLMTLIDLVETSAKPVIAAISGACMGGGLELALGAHYRVARPDASIALPEVKLGLLPGATGTQRLPRLIGPELAANLIVSGNPAPASTLANSGLFDQIVDGDLLEGALSFAASVLAKGGATPRVRDRAIEFPNHQAFFQFMRNMVRGASGPFPAPLKCIDAVQASCTMSFEAGCEVERRAMAELFATPESRSLRHAFLSERAAAKIPDVPEDTPVRAIAKIGVVGAGTMGSGIAMNFANAGLPVMLLEMKQEALDRGLATIRGNYEASAKKGKLAADKVEQRIALVTGTLAYADLAECDLVIEAVFEDLSVKKSVFNALDAVVKPGAILASNTSTLDVDVIASFTTRPQDVVGMHFFSPANVMRLLEVVRGAATAKDVLATVMKVAKAIKKTAVVARVCDGFIGNRMIEQYARMAEALVVSGATPWQVDKALETFGMAMGPFRMFDMAGNDIGWSIRKARDATRATATPSLADRLCEQGRFGQKTGKGWYAYVPGNRQAQPDPDVLALIDSYRVSRGIVARAISDEEIVQQCIYALVNEGARIVEEGVASRASDIDIVYLSGYGFPAHRGGPMHYADEVGLYRVARAMRRFQLASGDPFWEPAPMITRLLADQHSLT